MVASSELKMAAGHCLARAALKLLQSVNTKQEQIWSAYDLLDVDSHHLPVRRTSRLEELSSQLEEILREEMPDVPWEDVKALATYQLEQAEKELSSPVTPSNLIEQ